MSEPQPGIYEPGTVLGEKLRVERLLGEGGMGAVYEVTHELTQRRRALKLLHPQFARQKQTVERFLREASAAGKIDNPHIIETFDAGWLDTGEPFVLMEYLDGETLADRLDRVDRIPLPEAVFLFDQLCRGVHAGHEAGIVHRDLKPENIFLCAREEATFVKILDFGVSKFDDRHTVKSAPTRTGATIGTPGYMSLEQIDDSAQVDERSDVYALGVILYEALTGQHPFPANSFLQLAKKVAKGAYTPATVANPELPSALDELMADLLTPNRDARLRSAAALAERLAAMVDAEPLTEPHVEPQTEPPAEAARAVINTETSRRGQPVSGVDDTLAMEEPATVPGDPADLETSTTSSGRWWIALVGAAAIAVVARAWVTDEPSTAAEPRTTAESSAAAVPSSTLPATSQPAPSPNAPVPPASSSTASASAASTTSTSKTPAPPPPAPPPPSPPQTKPGDPDHLGDPNDL